MGRPATTYQIRPFETGLLIQAGALLASRQARLRGLEPALPVRIEDPQAATAEIDRLWSQDRSVGAAAIQGDRLVGYMIGTPRLEPVWGPNGWLRSAGLALAEGLDTAAIADLYAAIGARWIQEGAFFHFAMAPAAETDVVRAWFALGFGIEQVHALADLSAIDPAPPPPEGLIIRQAGPQDAEALAGFSELIWRELIEAPVWGITLPEAVPEIRAGYAELATDPTATIWMAEVDGRVVAIQGYWEPDEPDALLVPEKSVTMSVFSTLPEERGKGIQSVLTRHGLARAREAGYAYCETDWRSANRGVARSLPQLGFRPIAYRLVRRVDARIAWARGSASASNG